MQGNKLAYNMTDFYVILNFPLMIRSVASQYLEIKVGSGPNHCEAYEGGGHNLSKLKNELGW